MDSRGKYTTTYGFLECKMHMVNPDGHQTAFWLMPAGNGMRDPEGVDGTANDGAEIDIVEGNQTNTFSTGLHWDGYGSAHKGKGGNISAPGMHDTEYHVFGFEWDSTYLKWYYDGEVVRVETEDILIPHVPEFIYFSGSMWGNSSWVDGSIITNPVIQSEGVDKAYVDYVRVYKKSSAINQSDNIPVLTYTISTHVENHK
jgi:beta-glucanase (GH16 family)